MSIDKTSSVCSYVGCNNKRKSINNPRSFFKFPVNKPDILQQWIKNCGKPEIFLLDDEVLKNRYVCEKHFTKNNIYLSGKRLRLQSTAVPISWKDSSYAKVDPTPSSFILKENEIDKRWGPPRHTYKNSRTLQASESSSPVPSSSTKQENQTLQVTQMEAGSEELHSVEEHYVECKEEPITMDIEEWTDQLSSEDEKPTHPLQTREEEHPLHEEKCNAKGLENTKNYSGIAAFFRSMAEIIAGFSPDLIAETQSTIEAIVMEMKGRAKREKAPSTEVFKDTVVSSLPDESSQLSRTGHSGVADSSITTVSSDLEPKITQVLPASTITKDPLLPAPTSTTDSLIPASTVTTDPSLTLQDIPIKKELVEIKKEVEDLLYFPHLDIVRPEYVPENIGQTIETELDDGVRLGTYVTTVYNSLRNFLSKTMFKRKLEELVCEIRSLDDTENCESNRLKRIKCE